MDKHFNKITQIFKNRPNGLEMEDIPILFQEIDDSPNRNLILDIFFTTRSIEDRTLFYAYVLDLQKFVAEKQVEDVDADRVFKNIIDCASQKDIVFQLIRVFPYSESLTENVYQKLSEFTQTMLRLSENDYWPFLIKTMGENQECFTIRGLYSITYSMLRAVNDLDRAVKLGEARQFILTVRNFFPEDESFKRLIEILHNNPQRLTQELISKVVELFIDSSKKIDIAEIIIITRSLPDRLSVVSTIYGVGADYKKRSLDMSQLQTALLTLLNNDPELKETLDKIIVKR